MSSDRERVSSRLPYETSVGFTRGVRKGSHIAIAATAPIWPDGEVDPDPLAQARRCWQIAFDAIVADPARLDPSANPTRTEPRP